MMGFPPLPRVPLLLPLLLLLLPLLLPVDSLLDTATRRRLQRSRASHLLWTDSLTVSSEWRRYDFPVPLDAPCVLVGPPRGPPPATEGGPSREASLSRGVLDRPVFVAVRGLEATGFWHKLTSPCPWGETIPAAEETVSLLVTSSFAIVDGSGKRIWRARVLPPGETDPYKAERREGGPLAFALLQQQRRVFSQLLYADHIFPHRLSPFRDSPFAAANPTADSSSSKAAAAAQQQQQQVECERFDAFGEKEGAPASAAREALLRLRSLPGAPLLFWLDTLFESHSQLKRHQLETGSVSFTHSTSSTGWPGSPSNQAAAAAASVATKAATDAAAKASVAANEAAAKAASAAAAAELEEEIDKVESLKGPRDPCGPQRGTTRNNTLPRGRQ
ncbi:hypothetical protein Efla_003655 [Eimeria flavescens]